MRHLLDITLARYREDPKTGLPAPYYGPPEETADSNTGTSGTSHPIMNMPSAIDPQLVAAPGHQTGPSQTASYTTLPDGSQQSNQGSMTPSSFSYIASPPRSTDYQPNGPSSSIQPPPQAAPSQPPPFPYLRSASTVFSRASQSPTIPRTPHLPMGLTNGRKQSPLPSESQSVNGESQPDTGRVLAQLTAATESLLEVCASLKELMQQQREESRARTELMKAQQQQQQAAGAILSVAAEAPKEKAISMEKVTFATEILKNGPQNEEIKKAAVECLTKYLMRDL